MVNIVLKNVVVCDIMQQQRPKGGIKNDSRKFAGNSTDGYISDVRGTQNIWGFSPKVWYERGVI